VPAYPNCPGKSRLKLNGCSSSSEPRRNCLPCFSNISCNDNLVNAWRWSLKHTQLIHCRHQWMQWNDTELVCRTNRKRWQQRTCQQHHPHNCLVAMTHGCINYLTRTNHVMLKSCTSNTICYNVPNPQYLCNKQTTVYVPDLKNCRDLIVSLSLLICSQPGTNTRMAPTYSKCQNDMSLEQLTPLNNAQWLHSWQR